MNRRIRVLLPEPDSTSSFGTARPVLRSLAVLVQNAESEDNSVAKFALSVGNEQIELLSGKGEDSMSNGRRLQRAHFTVFTILWRFSRAHQLPIATIGYCEKRTVSSVYIDSSGCFASIVGETKIGRVKIPPSPPDLSDTFDNANWLTQIAQGTSKVGVSYDNLNRRSALTLLNGIVATYSYDNDSHLTGVPYALNSTNLGARPASLPGTKSTVVRVCIQLRFYSSPSGCGTR